MCACIEHFCSQTSNLTIVRDLVQKSVDDTRQISQVDTRRLLYKSRRAKVYQTHDFISIYIYHLKQSVNRCITTIVLQNLNLTNISDLVDAIKDTPLTSLDLSYNKQVDIGPLLMLIDLGRLSLNTLNISHTTMSRNNAVLLGQLMLR